MSAISARSIGNCHVLKNGANDLSLKNATQTKIYPLKKRDTSNANKRIFCMILAEVIWI